ncbi:30S ribosomal protein S1 [Candidatus Poribacteria bacterium]|nr:30S ribosomal protein S1 [Candidatus Poribacteria bacterium]
MVEEVKKEEQLTNDTTSAVECANMPSDAGDFVISDTKDEQFSKETTAVESTGVVETNAPVNIESSNTITPQSGGKQNARMRMEAAIDESLRTFEEGEILRGTVVKIESEGVIVDVGYKSEGSIPISEFDLLPGGTPDVRIGDSIPVYLVHKEDRDGLVVLSKKIADQKIIWNDIETSYEDGKAIKGKVIKRIKGGLEVEIGNIACFLPASQIELRPVQNFDEYIGKTLEIKVISLNPKRRNIVLSRRALLEDELKARRQDLLRSLKVGQIVEGTVKNIADFGAFVDLGGVDGLLHKVDMSWGRINHPSEIFSEGDKIEVMVLDVKPEEERVSLGFKQKTPDPWSNVEEKYPVDSIVTGKVTNVVDYGAFVELEEGVEGLIHITEMSWSRRLVHPSKMVKKGDVIEARVLDVDPEKQKISLGLKQLQPNPWELLETKYPVGSRIHGKVRNITDFGAFVEIERGIDGLIHVSDMSWTKRFVNPREILKEGNEVEVVVLSIDTENQRVSLGLKQVEPDPWLKVPEKYKVGTTVSGEVVNLTDFGAFVRLEEGVEGLIHISELDERHVETPGEIVSEGDLLNLKVISIDAIERRIGLSLRAYKQEQERTSIKRYLAEQKQEAPTVGALIKEARGENQSKN